MSVFDWVLTLEQEREEGPVVAGAKLTAAGRRPSLPANTRTSTHGRSAGDTSASGRVHARERGTRTSASATIGTSDLISLPATGVSIRTNRMVNGNTEQDVPDAHSPQVVPEGSGYVAGIVVAQLRELIVAAMGSGFSVIANRRQSEMGYWEARAIFTAKRAPPLRHQGPPSAAPGGRLARLVRASALHAEGRGFEPLVAHRGLK